MYALYAEKKAPCKKYDDEAQFTDLVLLQHIVFSLN
jgi:hypothetical protein